MLMIFKRNFYTVQELLSADRQIFFCDAYLIFVAVITYKHDPQCFFADLDYRQNDF
jgi:hypothetical protein